MILRRVVLVALLLVVVPAVPASAGGGGGCRAPQTEGTGVAVDLAKFCVSPTILHVPAGATVTWTNRDPVVHNVWGAGWSRGDLAPGQSGAWTFDAPGTYPYACTLHPGMTGAVVVGAPATPVAAVRTASADAGSGDSDDNAAWPLVIGLLGVVALGGAFALGTRLGSRRDGDVHVP